MEQCDFEEIRDMSYCTCRETCDNVFPKHQLDLYLPKKALPSKRPVVVFVHGGSWIRGDRRAFRYFFSYYDTNLLVTLILYYYGVYWNVGQSFAKSGIACAVISYRLSRLRFPWVLLELCASMLMSLIVIIVPVILLASFAFGFLSLLGLNIALHWHFRSVSSALIFLSLTILWLLVCHADKLYSITSAKKISPFIISFTITGICSIAFDVGQDAFWVCSTVCFAVCLSNFFLEFKNHSTVTHPDHVNDVALSLKFVKAYGETSKRYTADDMFVCGHSAGGHLVSLLALDKKYLQRVGLSPQHIKGVISISGVYNLEYLAGSIMEHLILRPAFGNNMATWHDASPFYCISSQENNTNDSKTNDNITFLIINAEKDFHLIKDASLFTQKLETFGHKCHHVIIKGVNHFSVAATFGRPAPVKGDPTIAQICCEFIWNNVQE